jgi:hypothetical protein
MNAAGAGYSPGSEFKPRTACISFLIEKVTLEQLCDFSQSFIIPLMLSSNQLL